MMGLLKTLVQIAMLGDFVAPARDLIHMAQGDDLEIVDDLETAVALSRQPGYRQPTDTGDGRWMVTRKR